MTSRAVTDPTIPPVWYFVLWGIWLVGLVWGLGGLG